jgi:hypothetical protein
LISAASWKVAPGRCPPTWDLRTQVCTVSARTYPNASHRIGKKLSKLRSVTSSFNVTVPSSGAYTTAYGIWDPGDPHEDHRRSRRRRRPATAEAVVHLP